LGLPFEVAPSAIDECEETSFPDRDSIRAWVAKTAAAKATAIAADRAPEQWVIGADTIVVLGTEVLHKPSDDADARAMLTRLQGRTHTVMTAVALRPGGGGQGPTRVVETNVTFYPLAPTAVAAYVARGESLDKAGAYAAQGVGSLIIELSLIHI